MEDEALLVLATGVVVETLLLIGRGQRGDGERLSFAAMKVFCGDTGADEDETILAAGKSAAEAD